MVGDIRRRVVAVRTEGRPAEPGCLVILLCGHEQASTLSALEAIRRRKLVCFWCSRLNHARIETLRREALAAAS